MGQGLSRKRSLNRKASSDKDETSAVSSNGDVAKAEVTKMEVNGSAVQSCSERRNTEPEPETAGVTKEKKKRKRFFFSLKRSRPGSGRKKKEKKDRASNHNNSADSGKSNRSSLFMDEFHIPEDHGIDAVSLSSNDGENKNKDGEEAVRRSKRGSKNGKKGKKGKKKKQKTEKKKSERSKMKHKHETTAVPPTVADDSLNVSQSVEPLHTSMQAAVNEAKESNERAATTFGSESQTKIFSQTDDDLVAAVTAVMDSNNSVDQDHKNTDSCNNRDRDTTSKDVDKKAGSFVEAVVNEEVVNPVEAAVQESVISPESIPVSETSPSSQIETQVSQSPTVDIDDTPKRVSLGPRLKTAILKKHSGAGDTPADSQRVTLTKPKIVDVPDLVPPPRKNRGRRTLSQTPSNTSQSELNTSSTSSNQQLALAWEKNEKASDVAESANEIKISNINQTTVAAEESADVGTNISENIETVGEIGDSAGVYDKVNQTSGNKEHMSESKPESKEEQSAVVSERSPSRDSNEQTLGMTLAEKAKAVVEHVINNTTSLLSEVETKKDAPSLGTCQPDRNLEPEDQEQKRFDESLVEKSNSSKDQCILKEIEIFVVATRTYDTEPESTEKKEPIEPVVIIERVHVEPYFGTENEEDTEKDFSSDSGSLVKTKKYSKETGEVCKECLCEEETVEMKKVLHTKWAIDEDDDHVSRVHGPDNSDCNPYDGTDSGNAAKGEGGDDSSSTATDSTVVEDEDRERTLLGDAEERVHSSEKQTATGDTTKDHKMLPQGDVSEVSALERTETSLCGDDKVVTEGIDAQRHTTVENQATFSGVCDDNREQDTSDKNSDKEITENNNTSKEVLIITGQMRTETSSDNVKEGIPPVLAGEKSDASQ